MESNRYLLNVTHVNFSMPLKFYSIYSVVHFKMNTKFLVFQNQFTKCVTAFAACVQNWWVEYSGHFSACAVKNNKRAGRAANLTKHDET